MAVADDVKDLEQLKIPVTHACLTIAATARSLTAAFCAYYELLSMASTLECQTEDPPAVGLIMALTSFIASAYDVLLLMENAADTVRFKKRREVMTFAALFGAITQ